jgi:hypothetical protein
MNLGATNHVSLGLAATLLHYRDNPSFSGFEVTTFRIFWSVDVGCSKSESRVANPEFTIREKPTRGSIVLGPVLLLRFVVCPPPPPIVRLLLFFESGRSFC